MKKIIALLMALCMLLSLATVVGATCVNPEDEVDATLTVTNVTSVSSDISGASLRSRLVDGSVSADDMGDSSASAYYFYANYSTQNGATVTIDLSSENEVEFSGLRFYSRRTDGSGVQNVRVADNVGKAYVSVSADGENYITSDLLTSTAASGNRYVNLPLQFAGEQASVSGVKYIKIEMTQYYGGVNQLHFGAEEITLIANNGETAKSIEDVAKMQFKAYVNQVDSYPVHGGLERKKLLSQAESALALVAEANRDDISEYVTSYNDYKSAYTNSATKELEAELKATSAKSYGKDGNVRINHDTYNKCTDGLVSKIDESVSAYTYMLNGNYAFTKQSGETSEPSYMIITMDVDPTAEFSGIRIYGRRRDPKETVPVGYQTDALVKKAEVTLYDENNTKLSTMPITAYFSNEGTDQSLPSSIVDKEPVFADLRITDENAAITGVAKAEIKVTALNGTLGHFGSEEIRLTKKDGEATEGFRDVLVSKAEEAINAIGEYPVYTGLERQRLIATANALVDSLTEAEKQSISGVITNYNDYAEKLNSTNIKEIDSEIKATSMIAYATNGDVRINYGTQLLTNKEVSKKDVVGKFSNFQGADFAFVVDSRDSASASAKLPPSHLTIKLTGDSAAEFTGIRFYSRKAFSDTENYYLSTAMPRTVEITLKNEAGESVVAKLNGKRSVKNTDADVENAYSDLMLTDGNYAITGITEIEVKITSLSENGSHFGSEEIRLINTTGSEAISDMDELAYIFRVDEIGRYTVHGGLEREERLQIAEEAFNALNDSKKADVTLATNKFNTYKSNYDAATVHEVDTTLTLAEDVKAYLASGELNTISTGQGVIGRSRITDGEVTDIYTGGSNANFLRGDWAMFKVIKDASGNDTRTYAPNDNYIMIKLNAEAAAEFSGIRFYARKGDSGTWYNGDSRPGTAEITLKDEDGNILSLGQLTATQSGTAAGQSDKENNYADFSFNIGGAIKTLKGVKTIEIKINSLASRGHFGCEEIRLLKHNDATEATALSDVLKGRVTLATPTVSAAVTTVDTTKTGTVRFVTSITAIDSAAELTEFGTYVIDLDKFAENGNTIGTDAAYASYKKTDGDFTADAVTAGTTFAVDVENIPEAGFSRKYAAVSFAKIAGYTQMITSAVCQTAGNELSE